MIWRRHLRIVAGVIFLACCICAFSTSPRPAMEVFLTSLTLWIWIGIDSPEKEEEALHA